MLELLNVRHRIIVLFAHVQSVLSVIHSPTVIKNLCRKLNVLPTLNVPSTQLVSIKDVDHHVLKETLVLAMPNAVSHIIDHSAIVLLDGVEIQMFDAINVSFNLISMKFRINIYYHHFS